MKIIIATRMEDDTYEDMYKIDVDLDYLSHEICMGIRNGLYGSGESQNGISEIAMAIQSLASAIERIKD